MNDWHPEDDLLVAFALDDLDSPARDEVATHLQECDSCARLVKRLGDALERYREVPAGDAPANVLVRLLEAQSAVVRRPRRSARSRWTLLPAKAFAWGAVLAVVFLSGFWAGKRAAPEKVIHPEESSLAVPLPEPPVIAFYPAVATE